VGDAGDQTYEPQMDLILSDCSVIFIDCEHNLISLVDVDGQVRWSHEFAPDSSCPQISDGCVYFANVSSNENYYLDCISMDGVGMSSAKIPPVPILLHWQRLPDLRSAVRERCLALFYIQYRRRIDHLEPHGERLVRRDQGLGRRQGVAQTHRGPFC
jgi:hypothetical protein